MSGRLAGIIASSHVPPAGGGFVPTDLASLELWLPVMSDATYITTSGTDVTALADKSGNGHDYSSTGAAGTEPQYGSRTINSTNVLNVDDVGAVFTPDTPWSLAQPLTVCVIFDFDVPDGNNSIFGNNGSLGAGTDWEWVVGTGASGTGTFRITAGARSQIGPPASGTPQVVTYIVNGASSDIRVDGSALGLGDPGSQGIPSEHTLFNSAYSAARGGFGEFVICSAALSGTDLTDLETYMNDLAGL